MTVIIYMILVDGMPEYVGSSLANCYSRRQKDHLSNREWLKSIDRRRIRFHEIDFCENEERLNLEHFYWDILEAEGYKLKNKKDPLFTAPSDFNSKESAKLAVDSKRRNGTIGNAGRSNKGKAHSKEHNKRSGEGVSRARKGKPKSEISKLSLMAIIEEKHLIMEEMNCSWKEAGIIRKAQRG